jgi:hypothetical protein
MSVIFKWVVFMVFLVVSCGIATAVDVKSVRTSVGAENAIALGSFNVQTFGTSFVSDPTLLDRLATVILRYDALFMMEIRDTSQTAIYRVLNRVLEREQADNGGRNVSEWRLYVSARLGRTSSKEQYAIFYRSVK